ncbi:MAG TPA: tetratricopeptide repeat protein [Pyrinomonadaceae bacterium]|nr:tetratricopeptide repeat protein [Pyrinomonadaceae bacterium]
MGTEGTMIAKTVELRLAKLVVCGRRLRDAGRYGEAEPILKKALTLAGEAFGPESIEVAGVLNHLGMLGKYRGSFDESEAAYRRALKIIAGSEHALAADLYHNLGGLEHARGNFANGEAFARRSVAIRTRLLGVEHPDTARDLSALAALLDCQGRYKESEALYVLAISILGKSDPDGLEVAVLLNNMAALCIATDRVNKAERLYKRSLAIKKRTLGPHHPALALTLNNLAVFYRSQGRLKEAARLYRRAIAIFETTLNPAHPKLTACRENYDQLQRQPPLTAVKMASSSPASRICFLPTYS